jgi:hypothetical protein
MRQRAAETRERPLTFGSRPDIQAAMKRASFLILLGAQSALAAPAAAPADTVPAQLNVGGFAYCLAQEAPRFDLDAERESFRFNELDLLLLYLSVYPGKRIPGLAERLQDPAHARWTVAFETRERRLAEKLRARLASQATIAPSRFFRDALDSCDGSPFCAALISHNVLRTLGRHEQAIFRDRASGQERDLNPEWFKAERELWLIQIPMLQKILMSLRPDNLGDGWGEWYHFFGVLSFAIHEMALRQGMQNVDFVVRLNELLNPLLAGGPEGAAKARLDRDSVRVDWELIRGEGLSSPGSCDERSSYVAL